MKLTEDKINVLVYKDIIKITPHYSVTLPACWCRCFQVTTSRWRHRGRSMDRFSPIRPAYRHRLSTLSTRLTWHREVSRCTMWLQPRLYCPFKRTDTFVNEMNYWVQLLLKKKRE